MKVYLVKFTENALHGEFKIVKDEHGFVAVDDTDTIIEFFNSECYDIDPIAHIRVRQIKVEFLPESTFWELKEDVPECCLISDTFDGSFRPAYGMADEMFD